MMNRLVISIILLTSGFISIQAQNNNVAPGQAHT